MRQGLARLARLGGRNVGVVGLRGTFLHATGRLMGRGVSRPVVLDGATQGHVVVDGADDSVAVDLAESAAHLLSEKLRAESEKNVLAGDILSKLQELSVLYDVSDALANARDVVSVGQQVLQHAGAVMTFDWGAFVAYDSERSMARIVAALGSTEGVPRAWRVVEPDSYAWAALNSDEPLLLPELSDSERLRLRRDIGAAGEGIGCLLAVPMTSAQRPVGVVLLLKKAGKHPFTSADAKLAKALASQAGVSVGHLQLHEESKEMFFSTVWSLASAVDAKDAYTHGHSQRVARYSGQLGRALGFDDQEIERLELSAVLHDVGKIGVPEAILNKPDRLTSAEMAVMKSHPEKGAEILSSIRAMRDIVPGVLHHHERFDGMGYPRTLKGENIPLQARIIIIADTFDAMTSTRPYRNALPTQVAIDEIRRCTGTQFDPRLADVFVELSERGIIRPIEGLVTPGSREGTRS